MEPLIRGLHHVTATADGAQEDLDCYASLLGLRLVKKTVNFDNPGVYHFYYGNEQGEPGTIWTTFPYRDQGVRVGTRGAGQITVTSFSVPAGSLDAWKRRLREAGVPVEDVEPRFGTESIVFPDPSGLAIELVANDRDDRAPWTGGAIGPESAIRGIHGVTLTIRSPTPTVALLTDVLGFEVVGEEESRTRLAVHGDAPGHTVEIVHAPAAPAAVNGLGTVHHVAFAINDADEQLRMRAELIRLGLQVTEVRDRQYFRSIYFREPGGVLFEVASVPPGFTVDETLPCLGRELKLPPWEEPNRAVIARRLPRVSA
jgi:glyoxalase family protein